MMALFPLVNMMCKVVQHKESQEDIINLAFMKDSTLMVKKKDMEDLYTTMAHFMKVAGSMINIKDKESKFQNQMTCMKVNGKMD